MLFQAIPCRYRLPFVYGTETGACRDGDGRMRNVDGSVQGRGREQMGACRNKDGASPISVNLST